MTEDAAAVVTASSQIDTLVEKTDLECMLEFETQIFLDIIHKDGLVVAAKGLNLDLVVLNLLKVYCDAGNLVIVMNAMEQEEKYFISKLGDENVHSTTFTTNITDREDVYLSGGIHFVTTRILVVDMLKGRVPIDKITGFVVLRAQRTLESCQEAFVLRLFRQRNKTGFIKAFSNSALSFTMGFGHVERVMRALFVRELFIWPRFHSLVIQCLKKHEPQVIELHVPISTTMSKIQTYVLELMNLTVKELKRVNKTIEMQEINVENCLTKNFHKILQFQLDAIWHQLSMTSKQLVADLKTLRHLILLMLYSDPVTFYSTLLTYRSMEYAKTSTWVLLQPAEMLFTQAKSLIFSGDLELNPEFCPKWHSLLEILKVEIPNELRQSKNLDNSKDNKILILCSDNRTCHQLNHILSISPEHYLFLTALRKGVKFKSINETFKNCGKLPNPTTADVVLPKQSATTTAKKLKTTNNTSGMSIPSNNNEENEDIEDFKNSYILTMSSQLCNNQTTTTTSITNIDADSSDYIFEPFPELENMNLTQLCESITAPTILIQTFKGVENSVNLQTSLEEIKPSFIILYHSNMAAIRQIEMYEAHRQSTRPLKVYFLIHAETVEEQSYLTTLRREKEAFEFLIETKSTMIVPEDQDGKSDICLTLQRDLLAKSPTKNTRKGGQTVETSTRRYIIVDMREFRSELPALIHKRGIDIEPVTITVGDYILTPDICVERKSLSDLIGSLNSGRLYQQCTQMSRYYSKPMLLIEFDQNKQFSFQSHYMLSSETSSTGSMDIQQKLLLLTLHFPKLKIIWSASPYASAQLFEELKDSKDEPNIEYASAVGGVQDLDIIETKYNTMVYDFVQKLPGITSKNIDQFLRQMQNLDNVVRKSRDELNDVIGNVVNTNALYSILHDDHNPKDLEGAKQKSKVLNKFKFTKKKSS